MFWANLKNHGTNIIFYLVLSFWIAFLCMYLPKDFYSMLSLFVACDEGPGICAHLITLCSLLIIFATLPVSLCFVVKVVQVSEAPPNKYTFLSVRHSVNLISLCSLLIIFATLPVSLCFVVKVVQVSEAAPKLFHVVRPWVSQTPILFHSSSLALFCCQSCSGQWSTTE